MSREQDWRSVILSADPDWARDSRIVPEYEFSSRLNFSATNAQTGHDQFDGRRLFLGDYKTRGPYAP
jgi:hypothetical protein